MKKAWHWLKTKLGHRKTYVMGLALIAWTWAPYSKDFPMDMRWIWNPVWYTLAILMVLCIRSGMSRGPK